MAGSARGLDSGMEAAPGFETGVGRQYVNDYGDLGESGATTGHRRRELLDRINARSECAESGCLEWTGNRNNCGYGQIWVYGVMRSVHRVVWEMNFGPIPPGTVVMHLCDNPACIDIDHLLLGTRRANVLDRERKGRGVVPAHQRPTPPTEEP